MSKHFSSVTEIKRECINEEMLPKARAIGALREQ
jgi:hypothetical protein